MGDVFLHAIYNGLIAIHAAAKMNNKHTPYLLDNYNVFGFFANSCNLVRPVLTRILNATIEDLNEKERIPCYVLVIIDQDLISSFTCDYGLNKMIKSAIQWLLSQLTKSFKI